MTPIRNEKEEIIGYRQEQPDGQVKVSLSGRVEESFPSPYRFCGWMTLWFDAKS